MPVHPSVDSGEVGAEQRERGAKDQRGGQRGQAIFPDPKRLKRHQHRGDKRVGADERIPRNDQGQDEQPAQFPFAETAAVKHEEGHGRTESQGLGEQQAVGLLMIDGIIQAGYEKQQEQGRNQRQPGLLPFKAEGFPYQICQQAEREGYYQRAQHGEMAELGKEGSQQGKQAARLFEELYREVPMEAEIGILLHMVEQIPFEQPKEQETEQGQSGCLLVEFHFIRGQCFPGRTSKAQEGPSPV